MIKEAKKGGADYCKFQTWSEKNLKPGPWDEDGRREIYKKKIIHISVLIFFNNCIKNIADMN